MSTQHFLEHFGVSVAAITAVVTFYLVRYRELSGKALLVADAFVLALFTMVGARKALIHETAPAVAVTMGVITGVAGGIGRDILTGELPVVFRPETYLYATAAFFGACVYVLLYLGAPSPQRNLIAGTLVTLLLRLAGIRWKIGLPLFLLKAGSSGPPPAGPSPQQSSASNRPVAPGNPKR